MKLTFTSFVADSTSHNANFAKATAMLTQAEEFSRDGANQEEAGPRTMKCGKNSSNRDIIHVYVYALPIEMTTNEAYASCPFD